MPRVISVEYKAFYKDASPGHIVHGPTLGPNLAEVSREKKGVTKVSAAAGL